MALSKADKKKLVDLKRKKLALLKQHEANLDYEHSNRIEFFGIADEVRAWRHSSSNEDSKCKCNLFKGANPKQQEIFDAWANETYKTFTFTGGNKLGKTTLGTVIAISLMAGYWLWDKDKKPICNTPIKIRYVGQDWTAHVREVIVANLKKWWPGIRPLRGGKPKKNQGGVEYFWVDEKTGSTLEIMSNMQDPDVFEGWDGHYILFDEPPKREIWIGCKRGLAVTNGRALVTATLLKEAWIHREVIKKVDEKGKPDPTVFNVTGEIYDNEGYGLTTEGIKNFANSLTEEEKQARLFGIPSYMSGLVYPGFKRETHLVDRHDIPLDWIVDIAIDCHPAKEQAVLFMATDPRNYKYLIDEIWMHGDGTQLADEIMRRVGRSRYRVNVVLIDHSAKGDSNQEFTTYAKIDEVLNRYQLSLDTYKKDEDGGIKQARTLLKGPNNKPSLSIFNDLPRTIYEIEGYMYDDKTQKVQNHTNDMMDNLYALANEDTQWYPMRPKSRAARQTNWRVA